MATTLNHDQQMLFVKDIRDNVPRDQVMEKYKLNPHEYSYYRNKLGYMIDEYKAKITQDEKMFFCLVENNRKLTEIFDNLQELISYKRLVKMDYERAAEVDREIENLAILYAEANAYGKIIIVPPRLTFLNPKL